MSVDKLEEVTRALYEKGLERGQSEAAKLLEQAKEQAAKLLAEAEQKAEALLKKADEEAAQLKNSVSADIQTQFHYALDRISNRLALHLTEASLPHSHSSEQWLSMIIDALIKYSLDSEKYVNDFTLMLPKDWEIQFSQALHKKIDNLIKKGIAIDASAEGCFRITLKNNKEGFKVELSPQELQTFISDRLSPLTKKMLNLGYEHD